MRIINYKNWFWAYIIIFFATSINLLAAKGVIKNDFLINDDVSTGDCLAYGGALGIDNAGNFIIVWIDNRNGDYDYDVYAQRYASVGNPIGPNFRVNDDAGSAEQFNPWVAMNDSGDFIITWKDKRNTSHNIYAQRYNSSGKPQGNNFIVNDDTGSAYLYSTPVATMNKFGNFVITWVDVRKGSFQTDIYAQCYDSVANPRGANFKVNDDTTSGSQNESSIAMDDLGNFVITWEDSRNGGDIYAQRYNYEGIPQGINFKVSGDTSSHWRKYPSVAIENGRFVITWSHNSDIYAQRYDSSGSPIGINFKVNEEEASNNPAVVMNGSGKFVITWVDFDNIHFQRYNSTGGCEGAIINVNCGGDPSDPYIATNDAGNFIIAWATYLNNYFYASTIYAQRYNSVGSPQGTNFKVNESPEVNFQGDPSITINDTGNFVITWLDGRNTKYNVFNVYAQQYNSPGNTQGINFKVNDDTGTSYKIAPLVTTTNSGDFVIAWLNSCTGYCEIYAKRYNSNGVPEGQNFFVSRVENEQQVPSIAMDDSGNFVITWEISCYLSRQDICAQRYNSAGIPQGAKFIVNDDIGASYQERPSIASNKSGDFIVTWLDQRSGSYDIYAQRYNSAGRIRGKNFKVNDTGKVNNEQFISIAMDDSGSFIIVWKDSRNGNYDSYGQLYNSAGAPQGSNFKVNDDTGSTIQENPSVAIDPRGGRFVIVWTDYRGGDGDAEVFAQKYENGIQIGSNVQINEQDLFPYYHQKSTKASVSCNSNMVSFVWMDNRRQKGWDIYTKLTDWDFTGIEENPQEINKNAKLEICGNPFIRTTVIRYYIPDKTKVSLKVYDLSGRCIKELVDEEQKAGNHNVNFSTTNKDPQKYTSGIYFLRLETGNHKETKKLISVKQ